jgi:hypothetical protein
MLAAICFCLIILGCTYAVYDFVRSQNQGSETTASSAVTNSTVASSINIFKTPYFQFQADKTWLEVPTESTSSKYVYRSLRSNLIEHELVVYVNQIPANLKSNRILPVTIKSGSELTATKVSDHCAKLITGSRLGAPEVVMDKVKFSCDADSTNYSVLVGAIDGTPRLTLQRPDKTSAAYALYYTNLRATPDANQILNITNSFQAR